MEKKTIGQFIAALRKANGLTQQEVADRLAVSNKAVSRWERDECAPDVSVIPALAELLGVTCDELLRGERITNVVQAERGEAKAEKQIRNLINRTISGLKTLICISITVALVGLICMFGISYGAYRPVIGFAIMLLFVVCAFLVAVLAVNRAKDMKENNELFEKADVKLIERYDYCLGNYTFLAFFVVLSVVMLSLPFMLNLSDYYVDSVLDFESYTYYLGPIAIILSFVYLMTKKPYVAWILQRELVEVEITGEKAEEIEEARKTLKAMNILQIGAVVVAGIIFVVAQYFAPEHPEDSAVILSGMWIVALCLLAGNMVSFIVYMIKKKTIRKYLWISGVRNLCLVPSGIMSVGVHTGGWWTDGTGTTTNYDIWNLEWLWYALGLALLVIVAFGVLEALIKKYRRQQIG